MAPCSARESPCERSLERNLSARPELEPTTGHFRPGRRRGCQPLRRRGAGRGWPQEQANSMSCGLARRLLAGGRNRFAQDALPLAPGTPSARMSAALPLLAAIASQSAEPTGTAPAGAARRARRPSLPPAGACAASQPRPRWPDRPPTPGTGLRPRPGDLPDLRRYNEPPDGAVGGGFEHGLRLVLVFIGIGVRAGAVPGRGGVRGRAATIANARTAAAGRLAANGAAIPSAFAGSPFAGPPSAAARGLATAPPPPHRLRPTPRPPQGKRRRRARRRPPRPRGRAPRRR